LECLLINQKIRRVYAACAIKLPTNVKFVKLGDTLYKLYEMDEFSYEESTERYNRAIMVFFPNKFPFTIE